MGQWCRSVALQRLHQREPLAKWKIYEVQTVAVLDASSKELPSLRLIQAHITSSAIVASTAMAREPGLIGP